MSDLKSTKSWHIQNLIDVEDDCQVVLLDDAMKLEQERNELAAQVERFKSVVEAVAHIGVDFGYGAYEIQTDTIDLARGLLSENPLATLAAPGERSLPDKEVID